MKLNRAARGLTALVLCLATLVTLSATASAEPTTDSKAKVSATLLDKKVKVNAKARIKGVLEVDSRSTGERTLQPIIVQRLVAGVWVNIQTTDCRPNFTFRLSVSFTIAAQYPLRVYYPTTAVFSSTLLLTVFG